MSDIFSLISGAFISWYITRWYFLASQKDLETLNSNLEKRISQLRVELKTINESNKEVQFEEMLEKAIQEYNRSGTPKKYIDTLSNLTRDQKASLFDNVFMRTKGRNAKQNPYL